MSKIRNFLKDFFDRIEIQKRNEPKINKKRILFDNVDFYNSSIGNYSYIARNSIVHNTVIGKFCSIGPNVVIGYGEHPVNFISTSPVFYEDMGFDLQLEKSSFTGKAKVFIGNDVWIGANVFIKNGITIEDGAVIGAGSVVLNDVPPFAIVVGVPGRVKSFRFNKEIIKELLDIKWWNWDDEDIKELNKFLLSNNSLNNLKFFRKNKS